MQTEITKAVNKNLLEKLEKFYKNEYQPLLNHEKTSLKNKTFMLPYIANQIYTGITNNIKEHFGQHLFRFINKTTTEITEDKNILYKFKKEFIELGETNKIFDKWVKEHNCHMDPICKKNCLDVCIDYCNKAKVGR